MSSMSSIPVRTRTIFIFLFLTGLLVYVNSLEVPFHFDDIYYLKENVQIKSLATFHRWLSEDYSRLFTARPLLLFTFSINYLIGGLDTFGYHLLNVLIHIMNAFLLYVLFARYADPDSRTGYSLQYVLAAVIFLIHPINTESVTYLSSRSSVLSTFFVLASMLSFFRATEKEHFRLHYYLLSFLFFMMGLFSKEAAIILPPLLILFDYFFLSRSGQIFRSRLKYHVPYILLTFVLFLVYLSYVTKPEADRPWSTHIPTELSVFVEYIRLLFIPLGLTIDHDVAPLNLYSGRALFSLVLVMSLLVLALIIRKTKPAISFALFWFFLSLSPFLVIRVNDFMAERWVYTASIGFAVGVTGLVMRASQLNRKVVAAVVVVLLVLFGTLTVMRNQVYASPVLLWEDAVRKASEKPRPYLNLSQANIDNGDLAQGVVNIQEGLALGEKRGLTRKERVAAYINLAAAYQYGNDLQKAEEALKMIGHEAADHPEYHHSLGLLFMKTRRIDQALSEFTKALAIRPQSPTYLYLAGTCYEALGQQKSAKDYFSRALVGVPQSGSDYINQSLALVKLGEEEKVLDPLFEGVRTDPFDLRMRLSLADALLSRQILDEAWKQYRIAAAFAPRSSAAYRGMGIILLSRGENREASRYFEKALSILPPESPERKGLLELLNRTQG
jgi:tetratricopeptide (TPR) repeat protein